MAAMLMVFQIGFLTEWQMYAQKIEGDSWRGEKLDKGKIDKMSGMHQDSSVEVLVLTGGHRPAAGAALRIDASYPEERTR